MKVAIMQPYIFPYIGYFQLISEVDKFVIYDNIQYTKKGWINRNRILINGKDEYITLPLKKGSDYLKIAERDLADTFANDKIKLLRKIADNYRKAPEYHTVHSLIEKIVNQDEQNLFNYIFYSLQSICDFLEIKKEFIVSSTLQIDHSLKGQDKVIAICQVLNSTEYINPIGGVELYNKDIFWQKNIRLNFLKSKPIEYKQYANDFIPWLSIIDVLMFNKRETVKQYLNSYYTII